MNPNIKEGRRQKVEHFKKQALLALTTAFRAPLMLMMGCGYVHFGGERHELHDHNNIKMVSFGVFGFEPYDSKIHGKIRNFVKVGDRLPNQGNSKSGKSPIHRHLTIAQGSDGSVGSHEFHYE